MKKRILALILTCVLALSAVGPTPAFATSGSASEASEVETSDSTSAKKDELQDQLDQLEDTYNNLAQRQTAIKALIANANSLKNQQLAVRNNIDEQISITLEQISLLEDKITVLEEAIALTEQNISDTEKQITELTDVIAKKEVDITAKQDEYDAAYETFKERLRVLYKQGYKTELELMFSAESYSDMLTSIECRKRITEHDLQLMSDLMAQKKALEDTLDGIQEDRAELEKYKRELEESKNDQKEKYQELEDSRAEVQTMKEELDEQRATADALANDYANQEYEATVEQAEILAAMQDAKAEMDDVFAELARISKLAEYVGGEFQWPLPGYYTITSTFGESRGYYSGGRYVTDVHTGTDISGSGVYGAPIIAANSGTVYAVVNSNSGYGNYVIIDHGGGYSTLYAHCSKLAVSVNQTVIKGDVIAYVGSTGNSTGPHLHFEVRINGKAVNAMQYFTKTGA